MAPVARGVADRQEDRPVELPGATKRLRRPRIPIDGVVRVLEKVRTRFGGKPVRALRACQVIVAHPAMLSARAPGARRGPDQVRLTPTPSIRTSSPAVRTLRVRVPVR